MDRRTTRQVHPFSVFNRIMKLTTTPFRISSDTYIRRIIRRWLARYILPLIATLATLVVLGIAVNPAFFIVALIFIFIVAPTALMFVYYFYGLTPRIVMLSTGLVTVSADESAVTADISFDDRPSRKFTIPLSGIREITPGDSIDTIVCGSGPGDILLLDKNAFASQAARIRFHNYIFDSISTVQKE